MIGIPAKRPLPVESVISISIPVPAGVDLIEATGCPVIENLYRTEYGLKVRPGYRVHATSPGSQPVLTVFGFEGSTAGSGGIFGTTSAGIWNCGTGLQEIAFDTVSSTSGYGVAHQMTQQSGSQRLLYCDEQNGYYTRTEAGAWTKIVEGSGTDGSSIYRADPANFVFAMTWKRRVWFVQKDSATAHYSYDIDAPTGEVRPFYFGSHFKHGGHLVGLWSWTIDGGAGIDDFLVAISSAGDVVVFGGTNPASDIYLKGVWYAGAVPAGRRIATQHGGDLLIISALGLFPLSRLLQGASIQTPDLYATKSIGPAISAAMTDRRNDLGWATQIHPEEAILIINTPEVLSQDREQWVLSMLGGGWSKFLGLPMTCMESFGGKLYFGTSDGHVCINDGNADLTSAIESQVITGFVNAGTGRKKRLLMCRPHFITDGTSPQYVLEGRSNYDRTSIVSVPYAEQTGTDGLWGTAIWGISLWGGGVRVAGEWRGIRSFGSQVAVACRMSTKGAATLVNLDVLTDVGGSL